MKKNLYTFIILLSVAFNAGSQTFPHQPAPPPVIAGNPLLRSLTVDCADLIVNDIVNGNVSGLKSDLLDYIADNYIGYVVLRDLENAGVFGNQAKEYALSALLRDIRLINSDIQIGICGSSSALFQNSAFLNDPSSFDKNCYGSLITNYNELNAAISIPVINSTDKKRNAIISFFMQVLRYIGHEPVSTADNCRKGFDVFYVDYPYWNSTSSMSVMQHDFNNFKDILSVLQIMKCNSSCIRFIDAEFLPTDLFKLQGWTAIDQITEADTLIDRVIIPSYTNNYSGAFNLRCKLMHFFSDQFSKKGTKLIIKHSAESPSFNYCNSSIQPNNYLGNFLNGTVIPSGNMYLAEKLFVTAFEDINYVCPACNCSTYTDNHYSSINIQGNILVGNMWTPYTMLQSHQLYRKQVNSPAEFPENNPVRILDATGRVIGNFKSDWEWEEALKNYPRGLYFIIGNGVFRKRVNFERN